MRLIFSLLLLLCSSLSLADAEPPPVRSVAQIDFNRYVGKWYEIAAFPMYFQRHCTGNTTAEYALKPDGEIRVTNRCDTREGSDQASGDAWTPDPAAPGQLKVSFFWPFRSNYWIIGLDSDYRWAVVGNPNRKYLWILSRTPVLPPAQLALALQAARAQHYDLTPLRYTPQVQP